MAEHFRYQSSDPTLRALLGRMYGETGMGAATQAEKNAAEVQTVLTEMVVKVIDGHAAQLQASTIDLKRGLASHAKSMSDETDKVLAGMRDHAKALNDAAAASDKYAKRLVAATWALFGATVGLAIATIGIIVATLRLAK